MNTLGTRRVVRTVNMQAGSLKVGDVVTIGKQNPRETQIKTIRSFCKDGVTMLYATFTDIQGQHVWKSFESVKVQVLV